MMMKTADVSHVATAYYVSKLIQFTANRLLVSFSSSVVQKIWMTTTKESSCSAGSLSISYKGHPTLGI